MVSSWRSHKNNRVLSPTGLAIAKEVEDKELEGVAYIQFGILYFSFGDCQKAIKFYQQGLRVFEKSGDRTYEGYAYLNLSSVYYHLRNLEKATEVCQKRLNISKETNNKTLEGYASWIFADIYWDLGDLKTSSEFQQKAIRIAKETGHKELEGTMYHNMGCHFGNRGYFENAIEVFQQALGIAKETEEKSLDGLANLNLGKMFSSLNKFSRAEKFFKSSIKVFEETRDLLQEDEWKITFHDSHEVYSSLWCHLLVQGKTTEALFRVERGRAQALRDLMESNYGVKSAQTSSKDLIERISRISSHNSSSTIFLAESDKTLNFWVLLKGQQCQFVGKEINQTLTSLRKQTYKQIGVRGFRCEERFLDDPLDEEKKGLPDRASTEEKQSTSSQEDLKTLSDVVSERAETTGIGNEKRRTLRKSTVK